MRKTQPETRTQPETSPAEGLQITLPKLQSVVRYYDDFSETTYSIALAEAGDVWTLVFDGHRRFLKFSAFGAEARPLVKHWCAFMLSQLAPSSVASLFDGLCSISPSLLVELLRAKPEYAKKIWALLFSEASRDALSAAKSLLDFLCRFNLGGWNPDHRPLLSHLRMAKVDKYAAVRIGDVFLKIEEESLLIRAIDEFTDRFASQPAEVSTLELREYTLLICAYQFGLRPKQLAMLKIRDARIWNDGAGGMSVHLTFLMIKQHSADRRLPMTRRPKKEWMPLFAEILQRRCAAGATGEERFFDVTSPREAGSIVISVLYKILHRSRSATELRHTAAQRLVDNGASQEELAAFLGQTDLDTGLVYYRTSASQAERVNAALGISETYSRVARIARAKFISVEELATLKGSKQIGGVPHGIPITGIGGCSTGQPLCPKNPIMSCYGCSKFMPVRDVDLHQQVLADLRGVVQLFNQASRADTSSPTYMQLRHTIVAVQSVLDQLVEVGP